MTDEPLSTPEEIAVYDADVRRAAVNRYADAGPDVQRHIRQLAEIMRGIDDHSLFEGEEHQSARQFGYLQAEVSFVVKLFGADQPDGLPQPIDALSPGEIFDIIPRLTGAKRRAVLENLACDFPAAFARAVRKHRPGLLPPELRRDETTGSTS